MGAVERETCFAYIKAQGKPVLIYGMGNGADRVIDQLESVDIRPAEVFASDEFVRGQRFRGFQVKKFADAAKPYDDFVILLAFGSSLPEVMGRIDGLDRAYDVRCPDFPVFGEALFDRAYALAHKDRLALAYGLLGDEHSKKVFRGIVNFKLSGKLNYLREIHTDRELDIINLIRPRDGDAYADLGAYDGDTVREMERLAKLSHIYALEPDRKNFAKLCRNMQGRAEVELYNVASYSSTARLAFSEKGGRNAALRENGAKEVQAESLDRILDGRPVDIVKMDVEGAEAASLCGMRETIKKRRPAMMISAYHRTEDFFELPILLAELGYCPKLRKHPCYPCWEVMVYCERNI